MSKYLLIFSADPGGAECLIPVIQTLPDDIRPLILCKDTAVNVFERHYKTYINIDGMSFDYVEKFLEKRKVNAVLTSASSLPEKDMTEKLLWLWAKIKGIPSIALLDQWQNYDRRFSGVKDNEYMKFQPDKIAIQDEYAKMEMLSHGFEINKLIITGHPGIENFRKSVEILNNDPESRKLKNNENSIITFFSQPIHNCYGDKLGFNENKVMNDILSIIAILESRWGQKIMLLCKLHPKNIKNDFSCNNFKDGLNFRFIRHEYTNQELIAGSDFIVGMNSIMLVHSVLAGIPTICYQPGKILKRSGCMPEEINVIPCIINKNDLLNIIDKLKRNDKFLKSYLAKQKGIPCYKDASLNVLNLIKTLMHS